MDLYHFCANFFTYFSTFVTNQQRPFQFTVQFKANAICNDVVLLQSNATVNMTSRNEVHCVCIHVQHVLLKQNFAWGRKSFKYHTKLSSESIVVNICTTCVNIKDPIILPTDYTSIYVFCMSLTITANCCLNNINRFVFHTELLGFRTLSIVQILNSSF
jgi:hypothetical protein